MAGGIFMIGEDGRLVQFTDQRFPTEDLLQGYVEQYPDLLAGDLIDAEAPRRWLLVRREQPLAREEGGAGWWSVDHVFLDQDAIPTFVEVKRSSDTRIRREVVGQMLEYAAHAVLYWPVEKMRAEFEATCRAKGADPTVNLGALLGLEAADAAGEEVERFWAQAKENLEAGHLRLLFVADAFPAETKRIIEFLNEKMTDVEVLAVEIRQFLGAGQPILVPRLHGQNEISRRRKKPTPVGPVWDKDVYFTRLEAEDPGFVAAAQKVYDWAVARGLTPTWGTGRSTGSMSLRVDGLPGRPRTVTLYTDGLLEFVFENLRAPFDDPEREKELRSRCAALKGCREAANEKKKRPNVPLSVLLDDAVLDAFLDVVSWWTDETMRAADS